MRTARLVTLLLLISTNPHRASAEDVGVTVVRLEQARPGARECRANSPCYLRFTAPVDARMRAGKLRVVRRPVGGPPETPYPEEPQNGCARYPSAVAGCAWEGNDCKLPNIPQTWLVDGELFTVLFEVGGHLQLRNEWKRESFSVALESARDYFASGLLLHVGLLERRTSWIERLFGLVGASIPSDQSRDPQRPPHPTDTRRVASVPWPEFCLRPVVVEANPATLIVDLGPAVKVESRRAASRRFAPPAPPEASASAPGSRGQSLQEPLANQD